MLCCCHCGCCDLCKACSPAPLTRPPPSPLKWINSSSDCVVPERPGRDESPLIQMRCYLSSGGGGECPDASRCCSPPTANWGAWIPSEAPWPRTLRLPPRLSLCALAAQSAFVFKAPTEGEQIYFQVRSRMEVTHWRTRSGNRSRLNPKLAAR